MGDIGGWGAHGGSKDARVTLRHTVQGQTSPILQVWQNFSTSPSISLSLTFSSLASLCVRCCHVLHISVTANAG